MNTSLFCMLPSLATMKPRLSPSSFSATFSTAELLFDTTNTVFVIHKQIGNDVQNSLRLTGSRRSLYDAKLGVLKLFL